MSVLTKNVKRNMSALIIWRYRNGISILFVNWYAAVVSLGLIHLYLASPCKPPISSFIGWVYILVRAPYRVGDRIEIGDARGDVIDVGYLDTTLWEIAGAIRTPIIRAAGRIWCGFIPVPDHHTSRRR